MLREKTYVMGRRQFITFILLSSFCCTHLFASSKWHPRLKEFVTESELIVIGDVDKITVTQKDAHTIKRLSTINIERILKGSQKHKSILLWDAATQPNVVITHFPEPVKLNKKYIFFLTAKKGMKDVYSSKRGSYGKKLWL